jgi:hypothetical protein
MCPVEAFIAEQEEPLQELLDYLHSWLASHPEVRAKISYNIPFYYRKSWLCYLNPLRGSKAVELAFTRANELSNEQGLLDFRGRKQVGGIVLASLRDIPEAALQELFQEALLLDEQVPYAAKRRE